MIRSHFCFFGIILKCYISCMNKFNNHELAGLENIKRKKLQGENKQSFWWCVVVGCCQSVKLYSYDVLFSRGTSYLDEMKKIEINQCKYQKKLITKVLPPVQSAFTNIERTKLHGEQWNTRYRFIWKSFPSNFSLYSLMLPLYLLYVWVTRRIMHTHTHTRTQRKMARKV